MIATSDLFPELDSAVGSRLVRDLQQLPPAATYLIALSGGLDSVVLLHALVRLRDASRNFSLRAVHVHHGLSPNGDAWARFCADLCRQFHIPLHVQSVLVDRQGEGLEAAARAVRYRVFEDLLAEQEVLLLAHHQNDQAETILLNLLRGAGLKGQGGMPVERRLGKSSLYRPLLSWSRPELERIAEDWQLRWVEDESNQGLCFDRNFLRHEIMPRLQKRWPAATMRLAQNARWSREADILLTELARQDMAEVAVDALELDLAKLGRLSSERQRNLLRFWLTQLPCGFPGESRFEGIFSEIIQARPDGEPELRWAGAVLRRYRQRLVITLMAPDVDRQTEPLAWDMERTLRLPLGELHASAPARADADDRHALHLRRPLAHERVTVRFRQGGERCRPAPGGLNRPLKKLFQEWGVAPWLRAQIPLLYYDETLVAVPGWMVAQGYVAGDRRAAVVLEWRRDGETGVPDGEGRVAKGNSGKTRV